MLKKIAKLIFLCVAPLLLAALGLIFLLQDLFCRIRKKTKRAEPSASFAPPQAASIVIPNWNGKDLLEKYLPSVIADCGPSDEIIVVDNASTDGSAEFVRKRFPQVRVLTLECNRGFGGGCNAGAEAARNPVVVVLNNDMRITPGSLTALLAGFTDAAVFAVSAQIFFSDPARRREETGLTAGWFAKGFFRVRHDIEERVQSPYPAFYAGGGSSAYDREKFLELDGFDSLFEPFYLEDTDLSYNAWRRGWKVLYQPQARVYHEHRGTIGKHFTSQAIQAYYQKNYVLMAWKNLHRPGWLCSHFFHLYGHMLLNCLGWETETRTTIGAFTLALKKMPQALRARRLALLRATISDSEVFHRVRPSAFREAFPEPTRPHASKRSTGANGIGSHLPVSVERTDGCRLNILFVSPYSIYPPIHGGAVFMLQAIQEISKHHNIFVLTFVDSLEQVEPNRMLEQWAAHVEAVVRKHRPSKPFHIDSHAQQVFFDPEFADLLDKMVYLHNIDLIQFEYTQLAQYRLPLRTVPQCLFEHDIYFRSVQRQLLTGHDGWIAKSKELLEWLRGLRYEVAAAEKFDAVFTCHQQEQRVLESVLGNGHPWIVPDLRTAIDASQYRFPGGPRRPGSLLFVGNFRHRPNADGLAYFCREIFPLVRAELPETTLSIVGANAEAADMNRFAGEGIRVLGQVPDIRQPLGTHAVFVCPIRTGAGVRVKILEAFASGIPVISTALGAEGLIARSGSEIMLADAPREFAAACIRLLRNPDQAQAIAASAHHLVEECYDWPIVMGKLEKVYRELVASRRGVRGQTPLQQSAASSAVPIAR